MYILRLVTFKFSHSRQKDMIAHHRGSTVAKESKESKNKIEITLLYIHNSFKPENLKHN